VAMPKRPARKYRRRSPWGNLFGDAIEDLGSKFIGEPLGSQLSQDAYKQQYEKMLRLKKHYGVAGKNAWYALALAIASEFDQGFKIVEARPSKSGRTARKWRGGVDAIVLAGEVEAARNAIGGNPKLLSILKQFIDEDPKRYGKYSLNHLEKNFYENIKPIKTTKQNKNLR